jgi:undecaprenyl-diphosphatase
MDIFSAFLLGLVQGLTEFLPISSSGHLVLSQHLLGFREPNLAFDILVHLGTLMAVVFYFRKDIATILLSSVGRSTDMDGRRWILMIIVGTIPTGIIGFAFKDQFEALFAQPRLVAGMLWITAVLLAVSDRIRVNASNDSKLTVPRSVLVGIAQGLAIIPGISRSGATITFGIFSGLNPSQAARFSFLLSIPAILGATLLEFEKFMGATAHELPAYIVGAITAFVSGYAAIYLLLKMVIQRKLWRFSIYLFLVGLAGLIFM